MVRDVSDYRRRARRHLSLWPQPRDAALALDHMGKRDCRPALAGSLGAVLLVCRKLRQLQSDLRLARCRDRLHDLVVDFGDRHPARSRDRRRDGAPDGARHHDGSPATDGGARRQGGRYRRCRSELTVATVAAIRQRGLGSRPLRELNRRTESFFQLICCSAQGRNCRNFRRNSCRPHQLVQPGNAVLAFAKGFAMNKDRVAGSAKDLAGKTEAGFGDLAGDAETQVEGRAREAAGKAQDLYGQAKDAARNATEAATGYAKDLYNNSGDTFRDGSEMLAQKVKDNPIGSVVTAGAIGFALALLMTRPARARRPRWRYYG